MAYIPEDEEEQLRRMLHDPALGAYLDTEATGEHYLLSHGGHTDRFYQLAMACRFADVRRRIAEVILRKVCRMPAFERIDTLIGIAMGGIPILYELQRDSHFMDAEAIWADKEHDPIRARALKERRAKRFQKDISPERQEYVLARNFAIHPDKRVVIVDDAYTTGGSISAGIDACNDPEPVVGSGETEEGVFATANIVGIIVIVNRSSSQTKPPEVLMPVMPMVWAMREPTYVYSQKDCPFCRQNVPLRKI